VSFIFIKRQKDTRIQVMQLKISFPLYTLFYITRQKCNRQYLACINRYAIILIMYIISTNEIHAVTDKIKWNFICLFVCLMVFNATFNNISAKTTDLSQVTNKLYHILLYTSS